MSTNRFVVDSWAWIEYFRGSEAGQKVKERIESKEIFTNVVTISEVVSKFKREGLDTDAVFDAITSMSKIIPVNGRFAKEVGLLHSTIKKLSPNFSLADAYALQTAKSISAKVLTGDPDFRGIKEAEILK